MFCIDEKFQFLYGAIGGRVLMYARHAGIEFQFLYGAIGGSSQYTTITQLRKCFNSYMVRLVDRPMSTDNLPHHRFQFLYGAIGGSNWSTFNSKLSEFQFLYGAIGGESYNNDYETTFCFNSYMVRLVVGIRLMYQPVLCVSIPIWCDWWYV